MAAENAVENLVGRAQNPHGHWGFWPTRTEDHTTSPSCCLEFERRAPCAVPGHLVAGGAWPELSTGRPKVSGARLRRAISAGELLLGCDERVEAVVVLGAGGAALEVGVHAGHGGIGVCAGELDFDITVEVLEALLAGELGTAGAAHAAEEVCESTMCGVAHRVPPSRRWSGSCP